MSLIQILVIAYVVKLLNFALCCMMLHASKDYFLYFAYGSNLLKRRIHINNPSAVFLGVGRLDKYKLDFVPGPYVKLWGGAVATIVPNDKEHVWGAVWRMQSDALVTLDKQEGVEIKQYFAKTVDVHIDNGKKAKCRTYQHLTTPPILDSLTNLPEDRRPSITYKKCIINGAIECSIPDEYIAKLKHIPDNGNYASDEIRKRLKF
ncbi:hypothetical protein B5X24_HaOG205809 [Helicoverpa armigera]|nr:gamma-glutamylcyclotransferase [Helicoverpa armigera]PZC84087.1 hypothetical protein B5X24_HaOG205809 [Helicoverpa armigera]